MVDDDRTDDPADASADAADAGGSDPDAAREAGARDDRPAWQGWDDDVWGFGDRRSLFG